MKGRVLAAAAGTFLLVSTSTWLLAAAGHGVLPPGDFSPRPHAVWTLTGPDAESLRRDAIRRAGIRLPDRHLEMTPGLISVDPAKRKSDLVSFSDPVPCRFLRTPPTGTSAKFDCVLDGGEIVKIKYSRNPEIQAETAATRLVSRLGFGADHVAIVPRLRCYGCPRFPFLAMQLLSAGLVAGLMGDRGFDGGYTDFEWVALERKFHAPAIETVASTGWSWWELDGSSAPAADVDAFRLLAVFLAHWDNKADNQRLVCLDDRPSEAGSHTESRVAVASGFRRTCDQPLLMIQDLGATFGPSKVNLARWREFPIWRDRGACLVSLRHMPFAGGTFPDVAISEEGRTRLGRLLASLTDTEIGALFEAARFQDYHAGTDDRHDLAAWIQAFRDRVDQILTAGPCPS